MKYFREKGYLSGRCQGNPSSRFGRHPEILNLDKNFLWSFNLASMQLSLVILNLSNFEPQVNALMECIFL